MKALAFLYCLVLSLIAPEALAADASTTAATAIAETTGTTEMAEKKELLANPKLNASGAHWFLQDATVVLETPEKGKAILNGVQPGKDSWSHIGTEILDVPIDHRLKFTCNLQGSKSGQKITVNTFAYDASHQLLQNWSNVISVQTDDWTPFSAEYVMPSNASSLTLWVINGSKYSAYVSTPSLSRGAFQKSESARPKRTEKTGEKLDIALGSTDDAKSQEVTYEEPISGWYAYTDEQRFEVGLDKNEFHTGTQSAYIKSIGSKPKKDFGNLMQSIVPNNYLDQRVKLTAWIKTARTSGTAQMWFRVDGEWKNDVTKPGTFDNMDDRPIRGDTGWKQYEIVCDIPPGANHVSFGLMLIGKGKIWLDDVSLTRVDKTTPLTGMFATLTGCGKREPINLNFETEK